MQDNLATGMVEATNRALLKQGFARHYHRVEIDGKQGWLLVTNAQLAGLISEKLAHS